MAAQQGGKGNPASKRMSNPKLKERRARSWARTERAKHDGTHPTCLRRQKNEALHDLRVQNNNLGQREVRRAMAGIRKDEVAATEVRLGLLTLS